MDRSRKKIIQHGDCEENNNSIVQIDNPNISLMEEDHLYHLALGTKTHDLRAMFGDVKFVVVCGSSRRVWSIAHLMVTELDIRLPAGLALTNIVGTTDRYAMYKVGPVLVVSHGIGMSSFSIMMHELIKLLHHSGVTSDVILFRSGTCGGIGLEPGTVVVTEEAVDGLLRPQLDQIILGKIVARPSILDRQLADELASQVRVGDGFEAILGRTLCTSDFYEGQARLDGAFCDYSEEERLAYLQEIYEKGVRNIEMESLCFATMCHQAKVKGVVACVTLLDRFKNDQVGPAKKVLEEWEIRPTTLIARLIKRRLGIKA